MLIRILLTFVFCQSMFFANFAQSLKFDIANAGNPVIPGFFADPSIVKMDNKYYIYATTVSKYMEPVVWISKNMCEWEVKPLGITGIHLFWAPSVIKGENGKYYLYYTNGFDFKCHLFIGDSPTGPWNDYGFVEEGFDLQIFKDPTNKRIYGASSDPDSRPRLVEFNSDPTSKGYMTEVIKEKSLEGPFFDYTEGSFILYKDGKYYLMYSGGRCHTANYHVRYSISDDIWGPYKEGSNNPVLSKDESRNVYGPGHHSVILIENEYYIGYHREDYYHWPTCGERQICIDKLTFDGQEINKILPTHHGIDFSFLKDEKDNLVNLAFQKPVAVSSNTKGFNPEHAVDNNYATRWMSGKSGGAWLKVDLGREYEIRKIIPYFVYYDYFNLYKIMYSLDNQNWKTYFDQSEIAKKAYSPVLNKAVHARYVKIQILRGEKDAGALFELKIFGHEK